MLLHRCGIQITYNRCSAMRSMFFMVLALWVLCESRGYGKQGMVEQEILFLDVVDRREQPSIPYLEAADGTIPNKPTQHVLSHDSRSGSKGHMPPDIADETASNKHSLSLLLDRDAVRMLSHDTERGGQRKTFSVGKTAADKEVNLARYDVRHLLLHYSNVPVSPYEKGWRGQSHTSSLEVVKRTSAEKEESAGQHSDVHMPLHNNHVVRVSSDAISLGAEGHISQLDVVAADNDANAVRRKGVDSALLRYAGLALSADLRTGVIYEVGLPPSLAGIRAQAVRLIPATLNQAGLTFNEFTLPPSASFNPSSAFITMVYLKITNFTVYTLPPEYEFRGPVVGIISSPSNSTSVDPSLPQASISLSISISLPMFSSNPIPNALCAFLALNGSIFVSNLASLPNICVASTLGYFALVVQVSSTPSPAQNPPPPVATASPSTSSSSSTTSKPAKNWKLIVGATFLTLAGLAFLSVLALISIKLADSFKLFFTSRFTGNDEALQNSLIGNSKAPTAAVMRTKPALEIDMAHFTNPLVA